MRTARTLLLVAVLLLGARCASADHSEHPSIVTICAMDDEGFPEYWGMGVVVEYNGGKVVLTCAHILTAPPAGMPMIVFFHGGGGIYIDRDAVEYHADGEDLAFIPVKVPDDIPPMPIAKTASAEGDVLTVYGAFNRKGSGETVEPSGIWMIRCKVPAYPGDSGSPICNGDGELVGITSHMLVGRKKERPPRCLTGSAGLVPVKELLSRGV